MMKNVGKMYKNVGTWWNDRSIDLVEIGGKVYALYGWNGEEWTDRWECLGDYFMDVGRKNIRIRPVYAEVEGDFEIVDYVL